LILRNPPNLIFPQKALTKLLKQTPGNWVFGLLKVDFGRRVKGNQTFASRTDIQIAPRGGEKVNRGEAEKGESF